MLMMLGAGFSRTQAADLALGARLIRTQTADAHDARFGGPGSQGHRQLMLVMLALGARMLMMLALGGRVLDARDARFGGAAHKDTNR